MHMKSIIKLAIVMLLCHTVHNANACTTGMSWLDNGQIKLGANLQIGGAITYIAESGDGINVINSHDWGRQVQMSFYSGPNPFEPNGKQPRDDWKFLGWNPIQSGDCYGNQSKVIEHKNDGKSIYLKCIPMHWPLENQPGECTFECWYTLQGRTVQVRSRINNKRSDKTQYTGRSQELPAVYTNAPYHKLMTYTGDQPYTDGALKEIPKQDHTNGIRWEHWFAAENWAALVNDDDWGLGVWHPGVYSFIGGFYGQPGKGGPKDAPTGYIAPLHQDILDHNIQYDYHYVLILDSLQNIRKHIYKNTPSLTLPEYMFQKDRQHWVYQNAQDEGWPIKNQLNITADGAGMQLTGPSSFWKADKNHKLIIDAEIKAADEKNQSTGRIYWKTSADNKFSASNSISYQWPKDKGSNKHIIDIGQAPGYQGNITGLRIDPFVNSNKGDSIKLKSIIIR